MLFSERIKLQVEYAAWLSDANRKNGHTIENSPTTFLVFLDTKGLLKESHEKKGHNCNEDYAACDQFVCSECGIELQDWQRVERIEDISYHEYVFRFCPNCGAKMEDKSEDIN